MTLGIILILLSGLSIGLLGCAYAAWENRRRRRWDGYLQAARLAYTRQRD